MELIAMMGGEMVVRERVIRMILVCGRDCEGDDVDE